MSAIKDYQRVEQRRILGEILDSLQRRLHTELPNVPEYWDGYELRQWVADVAKEAFVITMPRERMKDYKNDRLVRNV